MVRKSSKFMGSEKRRAARRPIIDSFSLFVSIPKKGDIRLPIHDVSELGISFDVDESGESVEDFPVKEGELLDIHIYLNQSLYVPVSVKIVRIEEINSVRKLGAEFRESSPGLDAMKTFVQFLDQVGDVGQLRKKS